MTPTRFATVLASVAFVSLALVEPRAQERRAAAVPNRPVYGSTTTAVLVDVVVRDKQDRPVTDLQAEDFDVFEDDVHQALGSFTRIARGSGIGVSLRVPEPALGPTIVEPNAAATAPDAATKRDAQPSATALVFDALSSEAAARCQKAAAQYLPLSGVTGTRIGVFVTEPTVHMLQSYTDDPALVRLAVRRLQPTNSLPKEEQREQVDSLRERREQLESLTESTEAALTAGNPVGVGVSGNIGQLETERRLVRGQLQMMQAFDTMDRDQRGYGTTSALYAVVQTLVEMPGRKTLVFFSEGLPASPALQGQLRTLIDAANRSNISVYAIDATGLRTLSVTDDVKKDIEDSGRTRLRQLGSPSDFSEEPLTRAVERAEDMLKFNSQGGLARLATETGGFLVRDTNDLRSAFHRIDEDIRFHYLLTYEPSNQNFDGTFRTIAVKVKRPGLEVYARKGYRALRLIPAMPVLDYEAPAIAALDAKTLPHTFPFTTTVLSFPESDRPGLSPVLVRVPTDVLTFDQDAAAGRYAGDAAVVVRFRNSAGDLVEKVSQQYHLTGKIAEIEAAKHGEILFYRQPVLAPGVYTVETAVTDTVGGRASAKVSTLEIPKPTEDRLRVSSLLVIKRAERVTGPDRHPDNPLYVGDLLLYPNGGEPLSRGRDRDLSFYYIVYRQAAAGKTTETAAKTPETTVELRRNGRTLARLPVTLGPADAHGRIQQMSRFPLETLTDGTYELCLFVHDGHRTIERSTFFTVTV
jgi:VWFA-related protein